MPCTYCGRPFMLRPAKARQTRDHVFPKSRFFIPLSTQVRGEMSNLVLACRGCNEEKGDLTPEEWLFILLQRNDPRAPRVREVRDKFRHVGEKAIFRGKGARS